MQSEAARVRARRSIARHGADVYPVALSSVAVFCLLTTLTILLLAPQWSSPVLDLPLGAYLLGGAGGVFTIVLRPSWARRLGSRHRGRVATLTFYRLVCAMGLGGAGFLILSGLEHTLGLVPPDWFRYLVSLAFGLAESVVNEVVLRALGFLAPREIDPRLL